MIVGRGVVTDTEDALEIRVGTLGMRCRARKGTENAIDNRGYGCKHLPLKKSLPQMSEGCFADCDATMESWRLVVSS